MTDNMERPVYGIVQLTLTNMERFFVEYAKPIAPISQRHGVKVLAASPSPTVLEGEYQRNLTVILEFPSSAAQEAWYNDPEYLPLIQKRQELSDLKASSFLVLPKYESPS